MVRGTGAEPQAAGPPTAGAAPVSSQARQGLAHGEAAPRQLAAHSLASLASYAQCARHAWAVCVCLARAL